MLQMKKKSARIRLIIDIVFCILFFVETIVLVYFMYRAPGEAGFGLIVIFQYLPILIFFLFWLRKDILIYDKASYIVRFSISVPFTMICTVESIDLLYVTIKSSKTIYLENFEYVLPLYIISLAWLICDIIRLKKRRSVEIQDKKGEKNEKKY